MATFVLVHGGCHGAWCWSKIVPLLEAAGHRVIAPDLRGMGDDKTPMKNLTLDDWTNQIVDIMRDVGQKIVLVGHSRGGMVISAVAERAPELIDRLIYLSAMMPQDGQALMDIAAKDDGHAQPPNIIFDHEAGYLYFNDEDIVPLWYADCSPEDIAFAKARLGPEPLFGVLEPVHVSNERFGKVPRYFIECTQDHSISLKCQRAMQATWPVAGVVTLDTSHSPFFSAPEACAAALIGLAARKGK